MKKILVLCDYGQTRSVAMAHVLRQRGHFVVSGSYENVIQYIGVDEHLKRINEDNWSINASVGYELIGFDKILFMQEGGEHSIGIDEYYDCTHPELLKKCEDLATELEL